jgi:hypothetical protein
VDHAANWFFFKPYSCHACRHRFYALREDMGSAALRAEVGDRLSNVRFGKNWRRNKREMVIYLFAGLMLAAMIYYLAQQRA